MKLIICSEKDIASRNMWDMFIENFGFKETNGQYGGFRIYKKNDFFLAKSPKGIIEISDLDKFFEAEYYVFASPHSSKKGTPCLTVHATGNFSDNMFGGNKKELGIAPSSLMKNAFLNLIKDNLTEFPVSLEVTHHGPTNLKKPVLFVEVGSKESEWNNKKAVETVCKAILGLKKEKGVSAIGFGGPHYAPNFTKKELNTELMFGHICPKYQSSYLDRELIMQMIEKTTPKPEKAIIDWKGLRGKERELIIKILDELGLKWEKL